MVSTGKLGRSRVWKFRNRIEERLWVETKEDGMIWTIALWEGAKDLEKGKSEWRGWIKRLGGLDDERQKRRRAGAGWQEKQQGQWIVDRNRRSASARNNKANCKRNSNNKYSNNINNTTCNIWKQKQQNQHQHHLNQTTTTATSQSTTSRTKVSKKNPLFGQRIMSWALYLLMSVERKPRGRDEDTYGERLLLYYAHMLCVARLWC